MRKTATGIVVFVGTIELVIILLGVITIPFPQWLGDSRTEITMDELQQMADISNPDGEMSQEEFQAQLIQQINDQMAVQFAAAAESNGVQSNGNERGQNNEIFVSQNGKLEDETSSVKSKAQATVPGRGPSTSTARTDAIVPISEWGCLEDLVVEQGYILADGGYIDCPLPIHMNDEAIADWFLIFISHGGYEPFGGVVYLFQKGEMYCIGVEWTYLGYCDCHDYYMATFFVYEDFVLDSSFYPYVDSWFSICDEGLIPGKEVDMCFVLDWTGCSPENNQDFTILSVRDS
ncbi:MAG: hypothetical protein ACFFC7_28395 [Candidatus Hermodarchaeota archaeon]